MDTKMIMKFEANSYEAADWLLEQVAKERPELTLISVKARRKWLLFGSIICTVVYGIPSGD